MLFTSLSTVKVAILQGYCCFKGHFCAQVILSTFIHKQNAPVEL